MKLFFSLLFINVLLLQTLNAKEVPKLSAPIIDQANLLSKEFENKYNKILKEMKQKTGIQLQILTIKSLEDESLEEYSIKVVDQWQLGKKGEDKGLLYLLSVTDRKMRIEVGRGLEGELTDAKTGRILDEVKVFYRNGEFDRGTAFILSEIMTTVAPELYRSTQPVSPPARTRKRPRKEASSIIFLIFFLIMIFGRSRRRSSMIYYGGQYHGGSRIGGSFGGGSSWGGSGGGFSGGGSSGSW